MSDPGRDGAAPALHGRNFTLKTEDGDLIAVVPAAEGALRLEGPGGVSIPVSVQGIVAGPGRDVVDVEDDLDFGGDRDATGIASLGAATAAIGEGELSTSRLVDGFEDRFHPKGAIVPQTAAGTVSTANLDVPEDIFVRGRHAYVADSSLSGVISFDISTPTAPTELDTLTGGGTGGAVSGAAGVYVHKNHLYVGALSGSFAAVDISDPASMSLADSISPSVLGNASNVTVRGDHAYVQTNVDGFGIVDVSDPTSLSLVGSITSGDVDGPASGFIRGDYLYVTGQSAHGLAIIDVSDPTSPFIETFVASVMGSMAGSYSVFVRGDYAYVGSGQGLAVVNVADPTDPTLLTTSTTSATFGTLIGKMRGRGNTIYACDTGNDRIVVIDISDRENPTVLGTASGADFNRPNSAMPHGGFVYTVQEDLSQVTVVGKQPDVEHFSTISNQNYIEPQVTASEGTSYNADLTQANYHKVTMTGDVTFDFTNADQTETNSLVLQLVQDGTGGRTPSFTPTVVWDGGSAPSWSTGANAEDLVTFIHDQDGSQWIGLVGGLGLA